MVLALNSNVHGILRPLCGRSVLPSSVTVQLIEPPLLRNKESSFEIFWVSVQLLFHPSVPQLHACPFCRWVTSQHFSYLTFRVRYGVCNARLKYLHNESNIFEMKKKQSTVIGALHCKFFLKLLHKYEYSIV